MHPVEFQRKWSDASVKERSGAQEHFIDICRLMGAPTPVEADPAGGFYAFEKGAEKLAGGVAGRTSGTATTSRGNTKGGAATLSRRTSNSTSIART